MTKIFKATLAIMMVVAFSANAMALDYDEGAEVTASATVGGITTLSVTGGPLVYGTTDVNAFPTSPADGKLVVNYSSNHANWLLQIATKNTDLQDIDSSVYQRGGMVQVSADPSTVVIPCKWVAKAGGSTLPDIGTIDAYNYIKDVTDADIPDTTTINESWTEAHAAGYANIAYGNADGGFCVDPTAADTQGDAIDGTIDLYIATLFGDVPPAAGDYTMKVAIDLVHE